MLRVYNTLHRRLEDFVSGQPGKIGLYTCGPTVYNPVTLGNWRAFIFDDVLRRSLAWLGYEVTHVMNVTDVGHLAGDGDMGEDKVQREAIKRGMDAWQLARFHEEAFRGGMKQLAILTPNQMPRATEHIAEQIVLIRQIEARGFTYQTTDGVYFDTSKLTSYGQLSGQRLEDKEAGARIEINPEKRHPTDFALWKFPASGQIRDMQWDSPWGVGFPGWHIECSAMSVKYLGQPFDIHCGGVDHIPVHHENEIAQTEAASGKPLAHYWLHNEFLLVDGRRMGKSEGNAYTLADIADRGMDPLAFRYLCLGAHYRSKLNFTWESLQGAMNALDKLRDAARRLPVNVVGNGMEEEQVEKRKIESNRWRHAYRESLEDDINTPKALAAMWSLLKDQATDEAIKRRILVDMDQVFQLDPWQRQESAHVVSAPLRVYQLAEQRQQARARKDWQASDDLRSQIAVLGWRVEDGADGSFRLYPN